MASPRIEAAAASTRTESEVRAMRRKPAAFNLDRAIEQAEAGDHALWEDIARHLLANRPKPRATKKRKATGPQTWAHVILADGREFLTSAYRRGDDAKTIAAHKDAAQFRARMEDSGDTGEAGGWNTPRIFLNPAVKAPGVKAAAFLPTLADAERVRDLCFEQRGRRQGWWTRWLSKNPKEGMFQ